MPHTRTERAGHHACKGGTAHVHPIGWEVAQSRSGRRTRRGGRCGWRGSPGAAAGHAGPDAAAAHEGPEAGQRTTVPTNGGARYVSALARMPHIGGLTYLQQPYTQPPARPCTGPGRHILTVPIPVSQVSREWPRHGGRTLPGLSMPFGSSSRFMPRMTSMTGPRLARCSTPGFIAPMPCSAEMEPLHRYALVAVRSRWACNRLCSKRPGVVTLRWRLPSPKWPKAAVVAPRGCSRDRISSTSS